MKVFILKPFSGWDYVDGCIVLLGNKLPSSLQVPASSQEIEDNAKSYTHYLFESEGDVTTYNNSEKSKDPALYDLWSNRWVVFKEYQLSPLDVSPAGLAVYKQFSIVV